MLKYCCVRDCKARFVKGGDLIFHRFPNNLQLKKRWVEFLEIKPIINNDACVCSLHFLESDYITGTLLKSDAIPSRKTNNDSELFNEKFKHAQKQTVYDQCVTSNLSQENKRFLARSYISKEEFTSEYKKFCSSKVKVEELYFLILTEIEVAISENNVDSLKKLSIFINYISDAEDKVTLTDYYNNANNPLKSTNLVILACKHNTVTILEYLLNSNNNILSNLCMRIRGTALSPDEEDETFHNALYYAIRSGNVELLDLLLNNWSDKYFGVRLGELDEILSRSYEELKLKNVPLSVEIEVFVLNKLIKLRFFSNVSEHDQSAKDYLDNIKKRIELVLHNISFLKAEYTHTEKVEEKFLFIAKFIAQNIHILKRQLKSTYNSLPWEEMEFCLISFVTSKIKRQEINPFYQATLNTTKILQHLENFAMRLKDENYLVDMDISKFGNIPNLKRDDIVSEIIRSYPQFEDLYRDHQQIRDMHSLDKISYYIKLALSVDPKQREGQLVITRVLQVIGEFLKNTLESPNLSNTTNELLLLSLPKNTRQIIIDLRNSLSHAHSLFKRTEIEENTEVNFFIGVQNNTKTIDNVISCILHNNKIKMVRILLKKIVNSESFDEIKEVSKIFSNVELDQMLMESVKVNDHDKLAKLIKELSDDITDKTSYEKQLFNQIYKIIDSVKAKSENIRTDYIMGFASLFALSRNNYNEKIVDHNVIRGIKFIANTTLENIAPKMESHNLKEITMLSTEISQSARSRMQTCNLDNLKRLTCEILYIAEFGTENLKWIKELRAKLSEKDSFISIYKQRKAYDITEEIYNNQLISKLGELKSILSKNALSDNLTENFLSYKRNKKLQAVVEMLVLDIMSILGISKEYLENNLLFLDDYTPLLNGKCLRNHIAHDNTLVDLLLFDPSLAVILNAKHLISENVIKSKKKIGKLVKDDPTKLKNKYDQSLVTITNQEKMFASLNQGNIESVKCYLKKGADINARDINSSTTLHFAAKGSSLEVIKFILDHKLDVNAKDVNGQTPLHVAAAHGSTSIVEFFISEASVNVDDLDHYNKTPLHFAAENGHKDTIKVLLKNNADIDTKDIGGNSPLHYAIQNNHIDAAKVMMEKETNVDMNETKGGFTSLHIAAEHGYLELVKFLLSNEANVNAKNDKGGIPLHTAALNGHIEVVKALILKGADVNARTIDGCTPLHYGIENGHEMIAEILLQHGANVNVVDKTYNNTPLSYASKDGHEKIVIALLKNKANASIATVGGITPLHLAAQSGHLKIVAVLLEHGVNIRTKDNNNATPLHYAADGGHKEVVELLIKNGLGINAQDKNNQTPLHIAVLNGHKLIIELLISYKAEIRAKDIMGFTSLHVAAMKGSKDIISLLIENKAVVDARDNNGMTPLYVAALNGHEDAIVSLFKHKADVNSRDNYKLTPLHAAILGGHKNIVNLLIKNKAEVNLDSTASTPLLCAIKQNNKEIVEILMENGANVNAEDGQPILLAVLTGNRDIVDILLNNKARVNMKGLDGGTALHLAASKGHEEIVKTMVARGFKVDVMTISGATPLYFAAQNGHEEVVKILVANGADVNLRHDGSASLHIAAYGGHVNIITILLSNGATINIKDKKNRTPLELAVAHGHLTVVKKILEYEEIDLNAKCNGDWTILHIASQESNLEIIKYLVDKGSNINAKNSSGSKPIHIAARDGYIETVKFFLSKGLSVNEPGTANQTLLHYAAIQPQIEVAKYLIAQGADVNVTDTLGSSPMHIAAKCGGQDVLEILLKNGAVYNLVDRLNRRPLTMARNKGVINLLESTEKLFESVKSNNPSEVENEVRAGAFVNAVNVDRGTSLHYAAWKGYDMVVKILLQNNANPNVVGSNGCTPIHYAAKFSHYKIVKLLLSQGAVYDIVSDTGKTPLDFAADRDIIFLLKLIRDSFKKVKEGKAQIINDLNNIKDIEIVKAVMNARNKENKSLVVAAVQNNFSKVEQLKQMLNSDVSIQIESALVFLNQSNYQKALSIFKSAFEKRKEILGPDNPGTLDIQTYIAKVLYKLGTYQEALHMLGEIFQKQNEMLGLHNKDTLNTRSLIALVLHRLGKDDEAYNIYQEVYEKQKKTFGPNHSDTLNTEFHMALVFDRQGKYEEALNINRSVFEKRKKALGTHDLLTVSAENNIAMVLANQGQYEQSLKIYKEVFEKKKKVLGVNHVDTLRTLRSIASVLAKQNKHHEALIAYHEVLNIQKKSLQQNHPETLNTQYNIASLLFVQGKHISALKMYRECLDQRRAIFGSTHPTVIDTLKRIELINLRFRYEGNKPSDVLMYLQNDINIAANSGDAQTVQRLLKDGADVNDKDVDGRTPLHYAISNGHINVVKILLKHKANVTLVTNKGNTPLHTATSKNYKEIVELLLQNIGRDKLNDFVNAKTTSSGTTSLHVAAESGFLDIVKSCLKHGANYKTKNKKGQTPSDLSKNQKVTELLKLIEELFRDIINGNIKVVSKIRSVKNDEFLAIVNARNNYCKTLLQVAVANGHKLIAGKLLEVLKQSDQI